VEEQLLADLESERDSMARLRPAIRLTLEGGDSVTRLLFEEILRDEEDHVDYLETQLYLYRTLGATDFLAKQMETGT
jgi:bacterioferritin